MSAAIAALGLASRSDAAESLAATFDAPSQTLQVSVTGLSGRGYALHLETPGLRELETGANVGEPGIIYLPPADGPVSLTAKPAIPAGAENFFFFNDLMAADGWELVVRFSSEARGTWKLNGRFSPLGGSLQREIVIAARDLERGENLLHCQFARVERPEFFFRRRLAAGQSFTDTLVMDRADWTGRLALVKPASEGNTTVVTTLALAGRPFARREPPHLAARWWERRGLLEEAVLAVGQNLRHAQLADPRSFFHGGFHLVHDVARKSYRMPHWIWAWGPSIHLLLELEKLPAAQRAALGAQFRAAAIAAGRRSLAFEVKDRTHPAFGISSVRWEPSRSASNGWVEYISTADSLFLAGWGWMPLYRATGDTVYLERTRSLVAAAERLMNRYPVVPQDWVVERNRWTPHTLDESVFGMVAFRELYAATKAREVAEAGRRFLDTHLTHMGRGSGLLERAWLRDEERAIWDPDVKGHAWVMEGYLDAHALTGDARYLELAHALAERVRACQHEDGSWTFGFRKPEAADPRDDKGTAIWAYLFYGVYRATHDERYLAAARSALGWCLRQQYRGDDPQLEGGLLNQNSMAYVPRRPMTVLYSTTFFGLALLEELKLGAK